MGPIGHVPTEMTRHDVVLMLKLKIPLQKIADTLEIGLTALKAKYRPEINAAGLSTGTKPHEPTAETRRLVQSMTRVGDTQEDIAKMLGLDRTVLAKYYRKDLDLEHIKTNSMVKENLLMACLGDVTKPATIQAITWWSKNRMGWADKVDSAVRLGRSLDELSDDELLRIASRGSGEVIEAEVCEDEPDGVGGVGTGVPKLKAGGSS